MTYTLNMVRHVDLTTHRSCMSPDSVCNSHMHYTQVQLGGGAKGGGGGKEEGGGSCHGY